MSAPETTLATLLAAVPRGDGPVFAAPWQARIFALIVGMVEAGHVDWPDFQRRLARQITAMEATGAPVAAALVEARYFDCWLAAVEELFEARAFLGAGDVAARIEVLREEVAAIREAQTTG